MRVNTHNTYQPSLVKHEQYFLTLQNHSIVDNRDGLDIQDPLTGTIINDNFYKVEPQSEGIYQTILQDPISSI